MNAIELGNLSYLNLLWIVAAVAATMIVASVLRRRALSRFATSNLVKSLVAQVSDSRRRIKAVLVVASLAILAFAMTDPRWGKVWKEVPQRGIDVVFAVDVSRSMLAEDTSPTRLERARQQIEDMVDAMKGDRVGLVAFAGETKKCVPLTTNYADFKQALQEIGPHTIPLGGSRLGDALTVAANSFLDKTADHKAIVVFTDGEDQESDPVETATDIYKSQGIRVFTVGLGDMEDGSRIPVNRTRSGTQWLKHDGQHVWSKLNGEVLREVALAADGAYIPAGTSHVDMASVYRRYVAQVKQTEFETARVHSMIPRHQFFVGLALLLLLTETFISEFRKQKQPAKAASATTPTASVRPTTSQATKREASRKTEHVASAVIALAIAVGLTGAGPATSPTPSQQLAAANKNLAEGKLDDAIAKYQQIAEGQTGRTEAIYNEGVARFRNSEFEQARSLFTETLGTNNPNLTTQARFNLGNCDYAEAVACSKDDRPGAIKQLSSAVSHFRSALQDKPTDGDARANLELATRLMKQLQQEEDKEQEEKQDQQQKDQQQQDQNPESEQDKSDQQNSEQNKQDQQKSDQQDTSPKGSDKEDTDQKDTENSDQSESSENQDQQTGKDGSEQDDKPSDDSDSESDSGKDNADKKPEDQKEGSEGDSSSDHPEDKPSEDKADKGSAEDEKDQSKQDDESDSKGSPNGDSEEKEPQQQTQPADGQPKSDKNNPESKQPSQTGTSAQASDDKKDESQPAGAASSTGTSAGQAGEDGQPMTRVEADKILQAVRDRDLKRRRELMQRQRRHVPVHRDW